MLPNGVMNAEDVARYLHLGKNTVYQLAKEGKLASYHVGRKLRFTIEDVDAYVASTHQASVSSPLAAQGSGKPPASLEHALSEAASFGKLTGDSFVLSGGDIVADLLASGLNSIGVPTVRLVRGSYTALVNLYAGDADAAIVDLYDQKSNSYNISYVRRLAPGASVVVFRLYGRTEGFIVQKGNPKRIGSWGGLLREGVRLSNRVKGSGARVLLDEKLRALDARSESIEGYDSNALIASAAIGRVACGLADVAVGNEREASSEPDVDFVPLQTEWVDLVVAKQARTRPIIRQLKQLLASADFAHSCNALNARDLSKLGTVVYES